MRRSQGIAVLVSCSRDGNTPDPSPPSVVAEMLPLDRLSPRAIRSQQSDRSREAGAAHDETRRLSPRDQRDLRIDRPSPRVAAHLRLERNDRRVDRAGLGQCGWLSHRGISRLSRAPFEEKTVVTGRLLHPKEPAIWGRSSRFRWGWENSRPIAEAAASAATAPRRGTAL